MDSIDVSNSRNLKELEAKVGNERERHLLKIFKQLYKIEVLVNTFV